MKKVILILVMIIVCCSCSGQRETGGISENDEYVTYKKSEEVADINLQEKKNEPLKFENQVSVDRSIKQNENYIFFEKLEENLSYSLYLYDIRSGKKILVSEEGESTHGVYYNCNNDTIIFGDNRGLVCGKIVGDTVETEVLETGVSLIKANYDNSIIVFMRRNESNHEVSKTKSLYWYSVNDGQIIMIADNIANSGDYLNAVEDYDQPLLMLDDGRTIVWSNEKNIYEWTRKSGTVRIAEGTILGGTNEYYFFKTEQNNAKEYDLEKSVKLYRKKAETVEEVIGESIVESEFDRYGVIDRFIDRFYFVSCEKEGYYDFPYVFSEKRFKELTSKVADITRRLYLESYYRKYDINKLKTNEDADELLARWPQLADEPIYVLGSSSPGYSRPFDLIRSIVEETGYEMDDEEKEYKVPRLKYYLCYYDGENVLRCPYELSDILSLLYRNGICMILKDSEEICLVKDGKEVFQGKQIGEYDSRDCRIFANADETIIGVSLYRDTILKYNVQESSKSHTDSQ